ncbi:MAG: DUF4399 domain-containing protein [Symploca sp. SIO2B6]|nr:DUF4399 domain-containing protein [Symploca sp. SIO2B6]
MKRFVPVISVILVALASVLFAPTPTWSTPERSPSPDGAYAYIIQPSDRAIVSSPFTVQFGLSGMGIAPAGIDVKNTGHHHLLIDVDELPDVNQPLAATDQIKHFGAGQTETKLSLSPGEHTLQLVLGNYVHVPHDEPVVSNLVHITVE